MAEFINSFTRLLLDSAASSLDAHAFPPLSDEQKALLSQHLTLSSRLDDRASARALNDALRPHTFAAGAVPSAADVASFPAVLGFAKSLEPADIPQFRHIVRYVDLVQHTLVDAADRALVVDHDLEMPREIKEKKKPAQDTGGGKEKKAGISVQAETAPKSEDKKELTDEEKKLKADAQKAKKAARAKLKAEQNAAQPKAAPAEITPSMVDIRVGFIQKCVKHPDADSLYMLTIDMGDADGPRTVCSGLVKHVPIADMQERHVVCIANLKPVSMRGVKSCAMVLCASNDTGVEFVNPPAGSQPGDKLHFEGYDGEPEKQLNPKKKVWETLQPHFSTTESFEVTYTAEGKPAARLVNARGELCRNSSFVGAKVN